jgi:hypothetical protein
MATQKRKRQTIQLRTKKQIIDAEKADLSKSYADLAKEFNNDGLNFAKSTMQTILSGKDSILKAIENGIRVKRAHLKPAKYEDLEIAILTWFKQVRSENVIVSGPLLKVTLSDLT